MSFQYVPTLLRTPTIPGFTIQRGVWRGTGPDEGLVAYNTNNSSFKFLMTQNLWAYQLKVDGSVYSPEFNDVNGYIYWRSGNSFLYYSRSYGWVLHNRFPGYEPKEVYNSEKGKYEGDAFHAGSLPGMSDGASSYFRPRGTNRNSGGTNKSIYFYFPRWQSVKRTLYGEYEPKGDVTGKKYLGFPRWRDNSNNYYVRSLEKKNRKFSYGGIRYQDGKWLLGEVNSPTGWWEGFEPSKTSPVTFRFCKPQDSIITGSNRTVSFCDYVQGTETAVAYMGEVAIWR